MPDLWRRDDRTGVDVETGRLGGKASEALPWVRTSRWRSCVLGPVGSCLSSGGRVVRRTTRWWEVEAEGERVDSRGGGPVVVLKDTGGHGADGWVGEMGGGRVHQREGEGVRADDRVGSGLERQGDTHHHTTGTGIGALDIKAGSETDHVPWPLRDRLNKTTSRGNYQAGRRLDGETAPIEWDAATTSAGDEAFPLYQCRGE